MKPAASIAQMRECDRITIEELGIPGLTLMESAAQGVVSAAMGLLDDSLFYKSILVFCGTGNNGGDGYAAARLMKLKGARVTVIGVSPKELSGDARVNADRWNEMGEPIHSVDEQLTEDSPPDLVVDALLGTGFHGTPEAPYDRLIRWINAIPAPVLAVDIPSGVGGDSGAIAGDAVKADVTVTFGLLKKGLLFPPGRETAGHVRVWNIGIPEAVVERQGIKLYHPDKQDISAILPRRASDAHKGDVGYVYILAGSPGMTGAACLSAQAALRAGAGLVTVGTPASLNPTLEMKLTEVMTHPLPENNRHQITLAAFEEIVSKLEWASAVAFGPGIGTGAGTGSVLAGIIEVIDRPLVIDADGLNLLAGRPELLELLPANTVLTPHPGEFSRLTGLTIREIQSDRIGHAREYAEKWGVTVVLKGAPTVTALPSGKVVINSTGNAGMATGGSGDILTGVIVSLLAQGMAPEDAAIAGVYLHGLAGDRAAEVKGQAGMVAGDIIEQLPGVIMEMKGRQEDGKRIW